ncbi:MAG: hypothetical protein MJD61_09680 [Proteobacteria bacterium]|nr:hypothetical protein [Pseudomonadota bacterium]
MWNPQGRRHYRRSYSLAELPYGLSVLVGLACVALWVAWMGAHPDPGLFANSEDLLDPGTPEPDRGALPEGLAAAGWREHALSRFDASNLYEKINGRADYFKSRGFVELTYLTLLGEQDRGLAVDIEFYDMGEPGNALGTYSSEKAPEIEPQRAGGSLWHLERNALFLTKGRYYLRAIGSDEGEAVQAQLRHLQKTVQTGLSGDAALPWGHRLFSEGLGIGVGKLSFHKENAFSFAFARRVYSALLDDGETELFVAAAGDEQAARELAERFMQGFVSYGDRTGSADDAWVKDRYLGNVSAARSAGPVVYGIRAAGDAEAARAALARLRDAVETLSPGLLAQAQKDPTKTQAPREPASQRSQQPDPAEPPQIQEPPRTPEPPQMPEH